MKEQRIRIWAPAEKTERTYKFDELPEDAKEVVRNDWRNDDDWNYYDWSGEINSMEKIAEALNCELSYKQYEWGTWSVRLSPRFEYIGEDELSGARAMAYVTNRFITPNQKPFRWSSGKVTMEFGCPFTGFYLDCSVEDAYMDWLEKLRANPKLTVADFFTCVESHIENDLNADEEYHQTDEYIDEEIEANWDNRWYLIDGTDVTDDIVA